MERNIPDTLDVLARFDSLQQIIQYKIMFLIIMKSGFRAWLILAKYCQKRTLLYRKKTFMAYLIRPVKP